MVDYQFGLPSDLRSHTGGDCELGPEEATIRARPKNNTLSGHLRRACLEPSWRRAAGVPSRDTPLATHERLDNLHAQDDWWDALLADGNSAASLRGSKPQHRWLGGLGAALALHLAIASLTFLQHEDPTAPSPGTAAQAFDVVMVPAWPEPGHHQIQLGSVAAASPAKPIAPAAPPAVVAAPNATSDSATAPVDPRPAPPPDSTAAPAAAAAVQQPMAPRADIPPSTPSAAETVWENSVLSRLAELKRYPASAERAGQQDTVMVRFVVDRTGHVLSAEVAKSRGFAALDGEARALIERASPLPAPPSEVSGDEIQLIAPIQFMLRHAY